MNLMQTVFKRQFSLSMYKNLRLHLAETSFFKDFVRDTRGNLYPAREKSTDCEEAVAEKAIRFPPVPLPAWCAGFFRMQRMS